MMEKQHEQGSKRRQLPQRDQRAVCYRQTWQGQSAYDRPRERRSEREFRPPLPQRHFGPVRHNRARKGQPPHHNQGELIMAKRYVRAPARTGRAISPGCAIPANIGRPAARRMPLAISNSVFMNIGSTGQAPRRPRSAWSTDQPENISGPTATPRRATIWTISPIAESVTADKRDLGRSCTLRLRNQVRASRESPSVDAPRPSVRVRAEK